MSNRFREGKKIDFPSINDGIIDQSWGVEMLGKRTYSIGPSWCLLLLVGISNLFCFSAQSAQGILESDKLIEYLVPLTGDEPRTVDLSVPFGLGSSALTESARDQLDELIKTLRSKSLVGLKVGILGHTDALGSAASNQALSEARAQAVVDYLVSEGGFDGALFQADGRGESQLLPGLSPTDAAHRRVEVVVHPPAKEKDGPAESDDDFSPIN